MSIDTIKAKTFKNRGNSRSGNTTVETKDGVTTMTLFGNLIATLQGNTLTIRNAGWFTVTTKSRLNAILQSLNTGLGIFQKKGVWYIQKYPEQPIEWDGNNFTIQL